MIHIPYGFTSVNLISASTLSLCNDLALCIESSASFFHASQACFACIQQSSQDASLVLADISSSFSLCTSPAPAALMSKGDGSCGEPSCLGECTWVLSGSNMVLGKPLPRTSGLALYGLLC